MCKFASFVLTKDRVFWSGNSNSHDDIISEHGLHEAGSGGRINIVRTEISPGQSWVDLDSWTYNLDQDLCPEWHDPEQTERRTRQALRDQFSKKPWTTIFSEIDSFIASIAKIKWLRPDGKPLKSWKLFLDKDLDAARAAARAAARDAAWDAAGVAARRAARDAARVAAGDAAGDAETEWQRRRLKEVLIT